MPEEPTPAQSEGESRRARNFPGMPFGPRVGAGRIEPHEREKKRAKNGRKRAGEIRVNPLMASLYEIPKDWLLKGQEGAVWHYSAIMPEKLDGPGPGGWDIRLGSEQIFTVFPQAEIDYMVTAVGRYRKKYPEKKIPELTEKALKDSINAHGHPGIAVGFTKKGKTKKAKAAVSGELKINAEGTAGEINDKSGRYMSLKVRQDPKERHPDDIETWCNLVAAEISRVLGIPITFNQIKTLAPPQADPVQTQTAAPPQAGPAAPIQAQTAALPQAEAAALPQAPAQSVPPPAQPGPSTDAPRPPASAAATRERRATAPREAKRRR